MANFDLIAAAEQAINEEREENAFLLELLVEQEPQQAVQTQEARPLWQVALAYLSNRKIVSPAMAKTFDATDIAALAALRTLATKFQNKGLPAEVLQKPTNLRSVKKLGLEAVAREGGTAANIAGQLRQAMGIGLQSGNFADFNRMIEETIAFFKAQQPKQQPGTQPPAVGANRTVPGPAPAPAPHMSIAPKV